MPRSRLATVLVSSFVPLLAFPATVSHASVHSHPRVRAAARPGDFNDDGIVDVAASAELEDVNGRSDAGAVYVFFGSSSGLATDGAQRITKATPGVPGAPIQSGYFGTSLAVGDFDEDGHSDLAIGDPNLAVSGKHNVGGVVVIPGAGGGLDPSGSVEFDERSFGGVLEAGDGYGFAIAAGDFDGDGAADLAIGSAHEGVNGHFFAGAVGVLYGRPGTGLGTQGAQLITQGRLPGQTATENSQFGNVVAAGDLDGHGTDDLVAAGMHTVNGQDCAAVFRVPGSANGLNPGSGQTIDPSMLPGSGCSNEAGGFFGGAMAVGDLGGDATSDLAIGAPIQDVGSHQKAGAVYLVNGGASGLTTAGSQRITEATSGVPGNPQDTGYFGRSLATGNFGNGPGTDLAVIAVNQTIGGFLGGADIFYRGDTTLDLHAQYVSHGTPGVPSPGEERFPTTAFAANVGKGGQADLLGGSTSDTVHGQTIAGALYVLYGASGGVTGAGSQRITMASSGVPGDPQRGAAFGYPIA